jgi:hypothetical protein
MRTLLLDHAHRYPFWELSDLYKLLHQAALGAEHALTNEAHVWEWLVRELADLEPDGTLVLVHLRPFAHLGLDPKLLLTAFFTEREAQNFPAYRVVARRLLPKEFFL